MTRDTVIKNDDDKVWVTTSYTVNLGNYENIKIEAGMSRTVLEREDAHALLDKITEKVLVQVINKGKEFYKRLKEKNENKNNISQDY